jgi:hypothetical protein
MFPQTHVARYCARCFTFTSSFNPPRTQQQAATINISKVHMQTLRIRDLSASTNATQLVNECIHPHPCFFQTASCGQGIGSHQSIRARKEGLSSRPPTVLGLRGKESGRQGPVLPLSVPLTPCSPEVSLSLAARHYGVGRLSQEEEGRKADIPACLAALPDSLSLSASPSSTCPTALALTATFSSRVPCSPQGLGLDLGWPSKPCPPPLTSTPTPNYAPRGRVPKLLLQLSSGCFICHHHHPQLPQITCAQTTQGPKKPHF